MKQYTEEELRAEFERSCKSCEAGAIPTEKYHKSRVYSDKLVHFMWIGWLECARFLGALEDRK